MKDGSQGTSAATLTNRRPQTCAFTLTELLVVIVMTVLLTGVLWSARANTGRKAGLVECKNNLRKVGVAIDQYSRDHTSYLPGPIWAGVYYTYRWNPPSDYGSMAVYLATYLGCPAPDGTWREAEPLKCPASVEAQPNRVWNPPIYVPICFISVTRFINGPGDVIDYPFGRPDTPYVAPQQTSKIRRPSEQWAMLDVDQRYLTAVGGSGATYYNYLPSDAVHTARPGGTRPLFYRNTLYFDWSVRPELRTF